MNMLLVLIFGGVLSACASTSEFKAKDYYPMQSEKVIPFSIAAFNNKSASTDEGACHSWLYFSSTLGDAFVDTAIQELSNYSKIQVLERANIARIYNQEVNLMNAEKTAPIERGHFKRAQYTIVGTVDSFEYCAGRSGIGLNTVLSGFALGGGVREEKATVNVLLRLVDTKTGAVVATASGAGEQTRRNISSNFGLLGSRFDVDGANYKQSSLASAIKEAIHHGTSELLKKAKL